MNKYPLDAKAIEDFSQDILQHNRAQLTLIGDLAELLRTAMECVDEEDADDNPWLDDADDLLRTLSTRKVDYENHRFNQRNGYNIKSNSPYVAPGTYIGNIDPIKENELNHAEQEFGPPMTEEELAEHFGETPPRKKREKKKKFHKMSLQEIEDWEKAQDNSNDIYKVSARVKNLARGGGAVLTPAGDMLCNTFTHVVKALYDFAETIEDKNTKIKLIETIRKQEGMPASLVAASSAGVKVKKNDL